MGVDSETRVRANREMVLKSLLDADARGSDPTLNMVRGNVKVSLEHRGDIDWDAPEISVPAATAATAAFTTACLLGGIGFIEMEANRP